jgi:hypothetical protein
MIDEDVLRRLLAEAADEVPPPGRAPEELLEDLSATGGRVVRFDRRRLRVPAAAAAAALVVIALIGVSLSGTSTDDQYLGGSATGPGKVVAPEDLAEGAKSSGDDAVTATADSGPAPSGAATAAGGSGVDGGTGAPAVPKALSPTDGARVVRTGSLALEVRDGTFNIAVEKVTSLAEGMGGYVAESSTSESDEVPSGVITVRVPEGSFSDLLREVRELGKVESVNSKGTDVTAQFRDLDARLGALNATRDRLLEVLRGARNVGDIIAVQDRITSVQTEIDQLKGQQQLLNDQASYGTLSITLAEPGGAKLTANSEPDDGIGSAWRDARRHFGNAIEGIVEASGILAVIALVLLVLGTIGWLGWKRGRRLFV